MAALIYDAVILFANAINNVISSEQYFEPPQMKCGRLGEDQKWLVGSLIMEQMLAVYRCSP